MDAHFIYVHEKSKMEHRTDTNYKNTHAHTTIHTHRYRHSFKNKNYKISGQLEYATTFCNCRCFILAHKTWLETKYTIKRNRNENHENESIEVFSFPKSRR